MRTSPIPIFRTARRFRLAREANDILGLTPPVHKVVDIGSGDGEFLRTFPKQVAKVGIDASEPTREAKERDSSITYLASALPIDASSELFQAHLNGAHCILRHVLEHVPNPLNLLQNLQARGVRSATISVPNANSPLAKIFQEHWYYWDPPRHLHGFTMSSLSHLFERLGWEIIKSKYQTADEIVSSAHRAYRLRARAPKPVLVNATRPTGLLAGPFNLLPPRVMKSVITMHLRVNGDKK